MTVVNDLGILIPQNIDLQKWAVVACDQFVAQKDYWDKLSEFVSDAPSTLKLTFPEIYLKDGVQSRVKKINAAMREYLEKGIFREITGFVLTERDVNGIKRLGIVLSVDLETYEYTRKRAAIRATEETILDRLPVRMEIRKDAKIELPHILLLTDDKKIIPSLYKKRKKFEKLYDFDLNMGGGHIAGFRVTKTDAVAKKFEKLLNAKTQEKKYGQDVGILFVVGDGNHSMAAAKEHWNAIKVNLSEEEKLNHPARFTLAEVISVHDKALDFQPIHRAIWGQDKDFLTRMKDALHGEGKLTVITPTGRECIDCPKKASEAIFGVQNFLEAELEAKRCEIEYVHGENHLESVVKNHNGIGLVMPQFLKEELFSYVVNVGNLPKKAFSIGNAENKKYYLEAKFIK